MNHLKAFEYSDKEAYDLIKEYYPDKHQLELEPSIRQILGFSKIKNATALEGLKFCLKLANSQTKRLYLLAAYYCIKTRKTMNSNIDIIDQAIEHVKKQYKIIENETGTEEYKALRREAVSTKIRELTAEKEELLNRLQVNPNIEVTGACVHFDGSEEAF